MDFAPAQRHYTYEEKRQLVANLDIEVAHRTRQLEALLSDRLEHFTIHQEGQISRIPKQIRGMTMREFGLKYEGNIQLALRGYQKERLAAAGADTSLGEIDKSMRKRKWVASQETDAETFGPSHVRDTDSQRKPKNARTQNASPHKIAGSSTGPGTAQRSRLLSNNNQIPGTTRSMGHIPQMGSPSKLRPPLNSTTSSLNSRPTSKLASPSKQAFSHPNIGSQQNRIPSSSSFNPVLPPKTPSYPKSRNIDRTAMRLPRKDESMLSVNGSPLANPYEFGLGWFKGIGMTDMNMGEDSQSGPFSQDAAKEPRMLKRTKSSIIIRRDPSVIFPMNELHSRTDSQTSFYTASSQTTTSSSAHSRENSQIPMPNVPRTNLDSFRFPSTRPENNAEATPRPLPSHASSFSALVAIPTKDGHLLEFDPLQTSPRALDALEGISDSAKKQAKIEMGRLIQATVDKWKIR